MRSGPRVVTFLQNGLLIKSSLTTLLYTTAARQKSVNNKVRVTKGVGIVRHTIFLCLKNGTLQNNEPYQRNVVHIPYLEYVVILDSYS